MDSEEGFLVLTFYEPRRRWYGKRMSKCTLEARVPTQSKSIEISWPLLECWIPDQYEYRQFRFPANIIRFD